jgi:quinoprotein glucose dehydrogenase
VNRFGLLLALLVLSLSGARAAEPKANASYLPALHDQQGLDAATCNGVIVPNQEGLRNLPITVECWARLNSAATCNILVASDTKASGKHWELYTKQGSGNFGVYLPGMGGDFCSNVEAVDFAWHYFAAQIEPNRLRMYLDGKLVKDAPITSTGLPAVPGDIGIGRLVEPGFACDGVIQDVRVSRGVKDVTQTPQLPLLHEDATIALWPLDGNTEASTRSSLPETKIIPAATHEQLTPANGWPNDFTQWTRSNGGSTSNRYVSFNELTKDNVKRLTQAWVFHSGGGTASVQCNPIYVDGILYVAASGRYLCALDAATGQEIWRFEPEKCAKGLEDVPARRGLLYWAGDKDNVPRIVFSDGPWLYALNPKTGAPVKAFGHGGRTDLPPGGTSVAPVLYKNVLIFPGFHRDVLADDVRTGAPVWTFSTLPQGTEFGATTWDSDQEIHEGCNDWGGISLDESRGIVYVATGSPKPNFFGMLHLGDNLFGNCVIALDATTGKRLWYFQEIRHDIWDLDVPAPPNLVTVTHDGMKVDAVAEVTKIGDVLLLDRVTGKPLFPFRMRRAPASKIPGERTAIYQPDPELPERVSYEEFSPDDVTDLNPAAHDAVTAFVKGGTWGRFQPFVEGKPNVYSGLSGGGEWVGASADPDGRFYVSVTQRPSDITIHRIPESDIPTTDKAETGERIFIDNCAACHRADRAGNGFAPSLIGLGERLKESDVELILDKGRGGMPRQPQIDHIDADKICAYLLAKHDPKSPLRWTYDGYQRLQDPDNYPGSKRPWGKLVCLDLNSGHLAWQVPVGEYPALTAKGLPKTGTPVLGGPAVTASGLVFLSGTQNPVLEAYNAATGAELWSGRLPNTGSSPPIIYRCKGHEYVELAACGGGEGPQGDAEVAFALPEGKVQTAETDLPLSAQADAQLTGYLDVLTDKLSLTKDERGTIKTDYLADGVALRDIMNDPSLSPLAQYRRVDVIENARDEKIELLLNDIDRCHSFHILAAQYRLKFIEMAAQGGFVGTQTFPTLKPVQD